MTGRVVTAYSSSPTLTLVNGTFLHPTEIVDDVNLPPIYSPMQVATAVTFTVGLLQVTFSYQIVWIIFGSKKINILLNN